MPGQLDQIMGMLGGPPPPVRSARSGGPNYGSIPPGSAIPNAPKVPSFWEWVRTMGFGEYTTTSSGDRLWNQPKPEQMAQLVSAYNEYAAGLQAQNEALRQQYDWDVNEKNRMKNDIYSRYANPYGPPPGYRTWGAGGR